MIPAWVNAKNGAVYLNDLKRYVKGTVLAPPSANTPLIITAGSAAVPNTAPPVVIESPVDAVSEMYSLIGEQDGTVLADVAARMTVDIQDVAFRRSLMSRAIPVTHVFGVGGSNSSGGVTGSLPCSLFESMLLEQQQTLLFYFSNYSASGSTSFRFSMVGRKFQATSLSKQQVSDYIGQQRFRKTLLQPYWLTTDQPTGGQNGSPYTINPLASQDIFFSNFKNSFFVAFGGIATFVVNGAGGGDTTEGFTVEMFDAKTERPLQNQPIARSCVLGSAGLPMLFPTGLIFEPNTRMRMRVTSLVSAVSIDVFITLIGVLAYVLENPFEADKGVAIPSVASIGVP